ncbi:MAG: phospholipid carrier-dependent glycosyltransferase [Actinobacteria bacterium]|nr:phospholipid carrier-dependent glycosyltransferase [Actinomycetota bacterium]
MTVSPTSRVGQPPAGTSEAQSSLRERLVPPIPGSRIWGWAGPLLVTAFAAFLRFNRLSDPRSIVFDETYYVKDAYGILHYGVEHDLVKGTDAMVAAGQTHIFTGGGEFVVHPPAAKMLIAVGEWIFGLNPFGWRFAAAFVGTLSVLLLARIARRMTRSTLLGCVAGLLLSLDGLEFVMSRTALLDIFLMFWVLAAFGCLVADRDWGRARIAERMRSGPDGPGPRLGVRWWRILAGICIGLACASKWDAIWYVIAFALLAVAWDIGARRAAGVRRPAGAAIVRDGGPLLGTLLVLPAATYLASWSGWFASRIGYDRNYAASHGVHTPVISALYSLFEYHKEILTFHVGLHVHHPYQSQPWTWLVMSRPVAFYYASPSRGHGGCTVASCSREVLGIGTPMIWWASIAALVALLGWWLVHRDWRAGAVLLGVLAGWLPWFAFPDRTKFFFYGVVFVPFLVLAITLCLGLIIGPARAPAPRRVLGAAVAGGYLIVVLLNFWYLYPVLADQLIPYTAWHARMWFASWI